MNEIGKIIDKISSYDLFNNILPGILFCYLINNFTRFSITSETIWVNLFLYYFVGLAISRIGSLIVEKILTSIKVVKKSAGEDKVPFINRAPYDKYIEAADKQPFILTLNKINNLYRTLVTEFFIIAIIKLYDLFIFDVVAARFEKLNELVFLLICFFAAVLFVFSYKKQTDYIRRRVNKYTEDGDKFKNPEEGEPKR